jgi:hypothetical protein
VENPKPTVLLWRTYTVQIVPAQKSGRHVAYTLAIGTL